MRRGGGCGREPFLDIRARSSRGGEQGLLSVAFHPSTRSNRPFYVNYTDVERQHARRRVPLERQPSRRGHARGCSSSTSRTRTTTAASSSSAPTGGSTSAWATAARGGDPENRAQNLEPRSASCCDRRQHARGAGRQIAALRAAQPVALLVRPRDRRPLHRRRRPERVGGDRLHAARAARASRTTAGTSTRERMTSRPRARTARGRSSCPCRLQPWPGAARSPAATSTAARPLPTYGDFCSAARLVAADLRRQGDRRATGADQRAQTSRRSGTRRGAGSSTPSR